MCRLPGALLYTAPLLHEQHKLPTQASAQASSYLTPPPLHSHVSNMSPRSSTKQAVDLLSPFCPAPQSWLLPQPGDLPVAARRTAGCTLTSHWLDVACGLLLGQSWVLGSSSLLLYEYWVVVFFNYVLPS